MIEAATKKVCVTVTETRTYKCDLDFSDYEKITKDRVKQAIEEEIGEFEEIFDCENIIDEDWAVSDVYILGEDAE